MQIRIIRNVIIKNLSVKEFLRMESCCKLMQDICRTKEADTNFWKIKLKKYVSLAAMYNILGIMTWIKEIFIVLTVKLINMNLVRKRRDRQIVIMWLVRLFLLKKKQFNLESFTSVRSTERRAFLFSTPRTVSQSKHSKPFCA